MAFVKKTWKNRIAEYINRRLLTNEDGSTNLVTVARNEGTISQEGDAFNAANMNDLEDRIEAGFTEINQSLTQQVADIYVGEDGKLHKVQGGADTVLPFSNLKYFIKNGILQDGITAKPPAAYTANNNCTTQNGSFYTYVGTSNQSYYCQISGIDLTDIDVLIIAATCPSSGNYWTLFDAESKVISTGKWTYADVRKQSGISFLRTYYGTLNIYNMFGMKYPV